MFDGRRPLALGLALALLLAGPLAGCTLFQDTTDEDPSNETTEDPVSPPEEDANDSTPPAEDNRTQQGPIAIVEETTYREDGFLNVVGLLENRGDENATRITVDGAFRDANASTTGSASTIAARDVLPAGERSPFQLKVRDPDAELTAYELSVDRDTTQASPLGEGVLSTGNVTNATDEDGYHVEGEVSNHGAEVASSVQVLAAFFGPEGAIQRVATTFTSPGDIDPNASASFGFSQETGDPSIASHRLWIEPGSMDPPEPAEDAEEGPPALRVVNDSAYRDETGYHVVGTAANDGDANASSLRVQATFYDEEGEVVNTSSRQGFRDITPRGEVNPFEIQVRDDDRRIDSYELELSAGWTDDAPPGDGALNLSNVSASEDTYGYHHVRGDVDNDGTQTANRVRVVAAFTNETGTVVAVELGPTTPSDIEPGGTASFDLRADAGDRSPADHQLWILPGSMG